jgi:hypothetical protein
MAPHIWLINHEGEFYLLLIHTFMTHEEVVVVVKQTEMLIGRQVCR